MFHRLLHIILRDYLAISPAIRQACLNLALFTVGWGLGTDTYWSIYMESIVENLTLVGVLLALVAGMKLLFNLPVAELDGKVDERKLIITGKIIYAITGLLYLLSGLFHSPVLLIIGLIGAGLANPLVYTSYQCYLRQHSTKKNSCQVFGLYNATEAVAYCGASFIAAFIVPYVAFHWFYVFVILFSLLSIPGDLRMGERNRKPIFPELKKAFWGDNVYLKVWKNLKNYNLHFHFILFLQFLWGLLDYASFLFIPLLGVENHLTLPIIAIIFGLTRLPYILSFFFAEIADKNGRMASLGMSLLITGCVLAMLGVSTKVSTILLSSLALSLCLASIRPVVGGVLTNLIMPNQRSEMTGVEEFVNRMGQIAASLLFGVLSGFFSIGTSFIALSFVVFAVGVTTLVINRQHKKSGLHAVINKPLGIHHFHPQFSKNS